MLNKKIGIKNVQSGAVTQPTSTSAYNMDRYETQYTDINYNNHTDMHEIYNIRKGMESDTQS